MLRYDIAGNCWADTKKNELKPWQEKQWVIAPKRAADFICRMEDILSLYERPYNAEEPVVCMDEKTKQLIEETRSPLGLRPGSVRKFDYTYKKQGFQNIYMHFEPLTGVMNIGLSDRQAKPNWVSNMKHLAEVEYPKANRIIVVLDNLKVHNPAAFYEFLPAPEARRLIERFEFHYTPVHGSWLNMAEIGLSILSRQCIGRRIGCKENLSREIDAFMSQRHKAKRINWRFTTADARIKLKRLYPVIESDPEGKGH